MIIRSTPRPVVLLALDRASVRTKDAEGRLHIAVSPISKANVCGYLGSEIPDSASLGLDKDQVYQLLRDPEEMRRAAATFNNLPVLDRHVPVSAEDHRPELVVGSTGTDAEFDDPYLRNSLVIWAASAIQGIEDQVQQELSAAYRYRADMTPGTYRGQKYDGVMRDLRGNHVALVEKGRAGPDIVVGDSALKHKGTRAMAQRTTTLSRKALLASGALMGYLQPKLAMDARIDLRPILDGVTLKNWKEKKPSIVVAINKATEGKLAEDADIGDVVGLLDQLDGAVEDVADEPAAAAAIEQTDGDPLADAAAGAQEPPAKTVGDDDPMEKIMQFLEGKLSPEDMTALAQLVQAPAAEPPPAPADAGTETAITEDEDPKMKPPGLTKPAMDAALAKVAKDTEAATIARLRAIQQAERDVRPFIGELTLAQDSAAAVYRLALEANEVDLKGVPEEAFPAMVRMLPKPGVRKVAPLAMDAAAIDDFNKRYPGVARIRVQ